MFQDEHNLRKAIGGMGIDTEPNPAHRQRLRRQMLATFEAAGTSPTVAAPKRVRLVSIMLAKLAVAAVIVMAAVLGIQQILRLSAGPLTFNQVRQATEKMTWLHAVVTEYRNGAVRTDEQWDNLEARKTYTLTADGSVLHANYGAAQQKFFYSPQVKAMVITELPSKGIWGAESAHTLVGTFAVFAAQDDVTVSEWSDQYEGETVRTFELDRSNPGIKVDGKAVARLRVRLMADLETRRLVAAHIEKQGARGMMLAREEWVVSYPQSGPDSLYALGVPRSVRVIDRTAQVIGTPPAEPRPISTPGDTGRSKLVPLKIELPKPLFVGTPQDNRVPNLARPRRGARPPFPAPPGTTNVAAGKPVASSDAEPLIGTLDMVTDGDKEAADGSFLELGPGLQHVTLDLQGRYEIYAVVVWHYHQQPRVYFDVVVQVSDRPKFGRGVTTVFNSDIDDSAGLEKGRDLHYTETNEGKLINTKGVVARYVRLYSQGNTSDELNHYIEVEVYGRPVR